jgi:hypothetical protein
MDIPSSDSFKMPKGYYKGGFVGGREEVPGSHPMNDTQMIRASAGEMIIPKEFAHDARLSKAFIDFMHKKHMESKKGMS